MNINGIYWQRGQKPDGTHGKLLHAFPTEINQHNVRMPIYTNKSWLSLCNYRIHDKNWAVAFIDNDTPSEDKCCAHCYLAAKNLGLIKQN